uniref:DDE-1 domain-containing protein n=1 Tax=Phlebotomus papatasi TaxID=29031 RepID=A0A1B0DCC6_PHLPP
MKNQLLDSIQMLCKKMKIKNHFTNGRPGRSWYDGFMKRHPSSAGEEAVSKNDLRQWFEDVGKYLEDKGLLHIDSSRIFNCDESGFVLSQGKTTVLSRKGTKSVPSIINAGEKQSLTVLFAISAKGEMIPLLIVYDYERMPSKVMENIPYGWGVGRNKGGWMNGPNFYEWTANIFYNWLVVKGIELPVILYLDGHTSHRTMELSLFYKSKGIELILLPPHATHLIQPLDTSFFAPMKEYWRKVVSDNRLMNPQKRVAVENLAHLLRTAMDLINPISIAKNGFRS